MIFIMEKASQNNIIMIFSINTSATLWKRKFFELIEKYTYLTYCWKINLFPMTLHVRLLDSWMVGRSVCHNFQKVTLLCSYRSTNYNYIITLDNSIFRMYLMMTIHVLNNSVIDFSVKNRKTIEQLSYQSGKALFEC